MKQVIIPAIAALLLSATGCKNETPRYVNPDTGESLELVKDANTGLMVDEKTKRPVYMYVDTEKNDTIFGETGQVVNGHIVLQEGKYRYNDQKIKAEDGEYKIKVESDGDAKIKDGTTTTKIDGETGEVKTKND
jgi:hypothetical protein